MSKKPTTAISPTRSENYPEWYQQVIKAADLAEISPVRGCMVIKPWGYAIWENFQRILDQKFKDTGHVNAYFPLFIPLSYLEKEAKHVEGFAKECAVVTHHRLEASGLRLKPAGELEEPYVIRPTSETIIGTMYAKWVQSYRDLPILINQWANVVRWELRTRMFLRTTEFLWQEGHTVHATAEEAMEETLRMLDIYAEFAQDYMAMPVIKGEKTPEERFPGAANTYSIEALMQDRKGLQAGTSHFLGQNFAKAQEIMFLDQTGVRQHAWTTSWGVSTRLVGGLIMTHSDDDGLILPPRVAPRHIVILPIYRTDQDKSAVLEYCTQLKKELQAQLYDHKPIEVLLDQRDMGGGEKSWDHIKKGVPIRVEVGPRDLAANSVFMGRRDLPPKEKKTLPKDQFVQTVPQLLKEIQDQLFRRAAEFQKANSVQLSTEKEVMDFFAGNDEDAQSGGFALVYFDENRETSAKLKQLKLSTRCIPLDQPRAPGKCIFSGNLVEKKVIIAKAY